MMKNEPVVSRKKLLEILADRSEVTNLLQYKPYTCMTVRSWYNDKEYFGFGFSKVMYPDKWDEETGADIAYRRAIIMIMRQVRSDERGKSRIASWEVMVQDGR